MDFSAPGDAGWGVELEPAVFVVGVWVAKGEERAEGVRIGRLFVDAGARGGARVGQRRPAVEAVVDANGVGLGFERGRHGQGNLLGR